MEHSEGERALFARRRQCAVCNVEFFGPELSEMIWCADDRFYVCGRCFDVHCRGHRQKGSLRDELYILAIFWAIITPLGLAGLAEIIKGIASRNTQNIGLGAIITAPLMAGLFTIPLAVTGFFNLHRERFHLDKVGGTVPVEEPDGLRHRPEGVEWINNGAPVSFRLMAFIALALLVLPVILVMVLLISGPPVYLIAFVFGAQFIFPVAFLSGSFRRNVRPSEFGVNDRGIYFWYRVPRRRLLPSPFIPWTQVDDLRYRSGKYGFAVFKLKSGRHIPMDIFKPGCEGVLPMLWTRWKETGTIRNTTLKTGLLDRLSPEAQLDYLEAQEPR